MVNRTAFLIDGFNLYHSVKNASQDLNLSGKGTRWLNISSMCNSFLHAIGNNAQTTDIYYFSALAKHIEAFKPDVVARHKSYIRCLEATGILVELSRFKKKRILCDHCGQSIKRHEEKETDVAIAVKLLEILFLDLCDTAVLVTGDTDVIPAVKATQRLFPHKEIAFLLPYKRHNKELVDLVEKHFEIKKETYQRHQFSDPFTTKKGKQIIKPVSW